MGYSALTAIFAVPLLATSVHASDPIIVESKQPTVSEWAADLQKQLERTGQRDTPGLYVAARSGLVSVDFQRGNDGKPSAVSIASKSGSGAMDRQALRLVSRINHLEMLPAGLKQSQVFRANIIFAEDSFEQEALLRRLARTAAAAPGSRTTLALNIFVRRSHG